MTLEKEIRVKVYATEMPSLFSRNGVIDHDDFAEKKEIILTYPNELFITVISANSQTAAGNFKIDYSYVDRVPEDVLGTMSEEDRLAYFDKQVIVTE